MSLVPPSLPSFTNENNNNNANISSSSNILNNLSSVSGVIDTLANTNLDDNFFGKSNSQQQQQQEQHGHSHGDQPCNHNHSSSSKSSHGHSHSNKNTPKKMIIDTSRPPSKLTFENIENHPLPNVDRTPNYHHYLINDLTVDDILGRVVKKSGEKKRGDFSDISSEVLEQQIQKSKGEVVKEDEINDPDSSFFSFFFYFYFYF